MFISYFIFRGTVYDTIIFQTELTMIQWTLYALKSCTCQIPYRLELMTSRGTIIYVYVNGKQKRNRSSNSMIQ